MAPTVQTLSFPLQAVNQPLAGMALVDSREGSYTLTVQVSGMAPGSVHSVHLHFGTCPTAGVHLLVLGTLHAGPAGTASVVLRLPGTFVGDGRFVIVYVGPSAGPLGGCAQLSGRN